MKKTLILIVILTSILSISCRKRPGKNYGTERRRTTSSSLASKTSTQNGSVKKNIEMSGVEIFNKYNSAVFVVYTSTSQGSGFFINSSGLAVSNYHVFSDSDPNQRVVVLSDNTPYYISEIIDYSEKNDYIVFRVDIGKRNINYIPIDFNLPIVGEKVYAIGTPKGLSNTFSSGEVSQLRIDKNQIQINVPIDHGSSGGALINSAGNVIGITTSGYANSSANLNFAMTINVIKHLKGYF